MFKKLFVAILLVLFVFTSVSFAYGGINYLDDDIAIIVTWQTNSGRWSGCGPIQRLQTSYRSEDEVKRLVSGRDYGYLSYAGSVGKYNVYTIGRKLKSYEYDARRCMN